MQNGILMLVKNFPMTMKTVSEKFKQNPEFHENYKHSNYSIGSLNF